MQKYLLVIPFLILLSCTIEEDEPPTGINPWSSAYEPVLVSRSDADKMIGTGPVRPITEVGKFYIYQNYLLFVEQDEGLHVYDNSNPDNPTAIAFLNLPNATDIAIKDNVLYANQSTDLVAVDITNFSQVSVVSRIPDVTLDVTPDGNILQNKYTLNRPENTIVIRWRPIQPKNE